MWKEKPVFVVFGFIFDYIFLHGVGWVARLFIWFFVDHSVFT